MVDTVTIKCISFVLIYMYRWTVTIKCISFIQMNTYDQTYKPKLFSAYMFTVENVIWPGTESMTIDDEQITLHPYHFVSSTYFVFQAK